MINSTTDVQEMISAFHAYIEAGNFKTGDGDNLLRYLLDRSIIPTYQRSIDEEFTMTDEKKAELEQIASLVCGSTIDTMASWGSYKSLLKLVTTYPPKLLQQFIIVGMIVYLLRTYKIDFEPDTNIFQEFYKGWGDVVLWSNPNGV